MKRGSLWMNKMKTTHEGKTRNKVRTRAKGERKKLYVEGRMNKSNEVIVENKRSYEGKRDKN